MDRKRVVVTGMGIVSSIGLGKNEFWSASLQGRSGVAPVRDFDTSGFGSRIAGKISDFPVNDFVPERVAKRVDPFVHFAVASAGMAP
jgi:3-oxoacyl-[acyl-carrier-protein] synthase II